MPRPKNLIRRLCIVEGCNNPHEARGYCTSHYLKFKRHGTPTPPTREKATYLKNPEPRDDIEIIPVKRLASAAIIQAIKDWHVYGRVTKPMLDSEIFDDVRMDLVALGNGFSGPKEELTVFFAGEMYEELCHLAGLDPDMIRQGIGVLS